MPDVYLSFVLLFTIFIFVVTQKLVLHQSKNVTAKCTENLSPPPCILYLLELYTVSHAEVVITRVKKRKKGGFKLCFFIFLNLLLKDFKCSDKELSRGYLAFIFSVTGLGVDNS